MEVSTGHILAEVQVWTGDVCDECTRESPSRVLSMMVKSCQG